MSFSRFPPTQSSPTTTILVWKWLQEYGGSFKRKLKKVWIFDQKIIEVAGRIGPNLKKKEIQGFMDSWIGPYFSKGMPGSKDRRFDPNF